MASFLGNRADDTPIKMRSRREISCRVAVVIVTPWWKEEKKFAHLVRFVMYCIVRRIGRKSPGAVYFSAVTITFSHAARALLRPAQNWIFQQDDVPVQHIHSTRAQVFVFCLIN